MQKNLKIAVFVFLALVLTGGGVFAFQRFADKEQSQPNKQLQVSTSNAQDQKNEAQIKIGKYDMKEVRKEYKAWEELVLVETVDISPSSLYADFAKIYPSYTNSKNAVYVKNLVVRGETMEVYFGGDEAALTERMGTTGAQIYAGTITFALTEEPKIKAVDFKLQNEGNHFGPGVRTRKDFMDMWSISLLETRASQGDSEAKSILSFRQSE